MLRLHSRLDCLGHKRLLLDPDLPPLAKNATMSLYLASLLTNPSSLSVLNVAKTQPFWETSDTVRGLSETKRSGSGKRVLRDCRKQTRLLWKFDLVQSAGRGLQQRIAGHREARSRQWIESERKWGRSAETLQSERGRGE